jgi:hypothetical protein
MSSMSRKTFQGVALLLFGFVPIVALIYAVDARSLPTALMAHFDSSTGKPVAWITTSRFLELYLGCAVVVGVAGSAAALLTPRGWEPDVVSWAALTGLFTATALMMYSERVILKQVPSRFAHDPVVDSLFLTGMAMIIACYLFRWTQR